MWCDGKSISEWKQNHRDLVRYLHGQCDDWVSKNHQSGDKFVIFSDEDTTYLCLLHCCIYRNGKYIDVRGETENIEDILEDFSFVNLRRFDYNTFDEFCDKCENLLNP